MGNNILQRFLGSPYVHNRLRVQIGAKVGPHLIPIHRNALLTQRDLRHAVHKVVVRLARRHVLALHPCSNVGSFVPAVRVHLVATQVHKVLWEETAILDTASELIQHVREYFKSLVGRRVQRCEARVAGADIVARSAHSLRMTWGINFYHHAHSATLGVENQILDITHRIPKRRIVRALGQSGARLRRVWEALRVHHMPMQCVQFGVHH
mmetsp:Transcript_6178/g.11729  ORF Transcript_6178/g.11729 Transcript_6178/m.11729 type:complete len:209 (-) Transcript_6178:154-780(-)